MRCYQEKPEEETDSKENSYRLNNRIINQCNIELYIEKKQTVVNVPQEHVLECQYDHILNRIPGNNKGRCFCGAKWS